MRDLQVHAFSFSCQSVYKPTSLSSLHSIAPTSRLRHDGIKDRTEDLSHMQAMAEGRRGRWTTTRGEHRRGYEQQRKGTLAIYTICLSVCLSFCLPHAGYGGGTTTRGMVAGREDNVYIADESTLAILPVCCCSTCRLWRRDNDEEDGGDDEGTRGQHCRRKYVGYTTCLLLFGFVFF